MAEIFDLVRLMNVGTISRWVRGTVAGISPRNPEPVDWRILMKRLYYAAVRLVGGSGRAVDCGVASAEDLVSEALTAFFDSPNGLSWDGTEKGLTRLLCRVLLNKYLDHLRRDKKVLQDPETALAELICQQVGPEEQAACKVIEGRLLAAVRGHPHQKKLEDFIIAASCLTETSVIDKQIAELLDVTPSEVRNRRKMLLRIASIQELGRLL